MERAQHVILLGSFSTVLIHTEPASLNCFHPKMLRSTAGCSLDLDLKRKHSCKDFRFPTSFCTRQEKDKSAFQGFSLHFQLHPVGMVPRGHKAGITSQDEIPRSVLCLCNPIGYLQLIIFVVTYFQ